MLALSLSSWVISVIFLFKYQSVSLSVNITVKIRSDAFQGLGSKMHNYTI